MNKKLEIKHDAKRYDEHITYGLILRFSDPDFRTCIMAGAELLAYFVWDGEKYIDLEESLKFILGLPVGIINKQMAEFTKDMELTKLFGLDKKDE